VLQKIANTIAYAAEDHRVGRALVGPGFIAVELENGTVGLSANIALSQTQGCTIFPDAGTLAGSRASDVLKLVSRGDFLSRELALATVNALINTLHPAPFGDAFDHIEIRPRQRAVIVGLIEPVARMLTEKGCTVSIFENRPVLHPQVESHEMMPARIREADIVVLSGTTLINATIEEILAMPSPAKAWVLMGPSTPMIPEAFSRTPVTHLAGARILDNERAFTLLMEGGGTKELYHSGTMKKVTQEVR